MENLKVRLRRIEPNHSKLKLFLMLGPKSHSTGIKLDHDDTAFEVGLGTLTVDNRIFGYTEISFLAKIESDLELLSRDLSGGPKSPGVQIIWPETAILRRRQAAEREKLEDALSKFVPSICGAVNRFRQACKVALLRESTGGMRIAQQITDHQKHLGFPQDSFGDAFVPDDTIFLFRTFEKLTEVTFLAEATVEYRVSDSNDHEIVGNLRRGYRVGNSVTQLASEWGAIQELLTTGWPFELEALLSAFEFLYAGDFRMALFSAATVLEFSVAKLWDDKKSQLESGSREDKMKLEGLKRRMSSKQSQFQNAVESRIMIVLPEFLGQELSKDGTFERCRRAWSIRNSRVGHFVENNTDGAVSRDEAWSAVVSIFRVVEAISKHVAIKLP